ncbi:MAG: arginine--tRNA ligase [Lachnospiraceae bacterium]
MKKFMDAISEEMAKAFEQAGYEASYGKVSVSNRPDLCEYQCNGAMAGAKAYKKAPIMIANEVAALLRDSEVFSEVTAVMPGFLNLKLKESFLCDYVKKMMQEEKYGVEMPENPKTIVVDYGGPNVAKPLHVGHLRPAIIGESIKRIARYAGHKVIGDVHLGDWGLPMGQIITELQVRNPQLPYFDEDFTGEYPEKAPFTISELEEIYPFASGKCKQDEEYKAKALEATAQLQSGRRGYRALWQHILNVSVTDLKKNYEKLDVHFDLWNGESDVDDLIPPMVEKMKSEGFAYLSDGALVVDVKEETDKKELPPCIILKSDGAANYETTDLATIIQRERDFKPNQILYVVDKRQELHFEQVFRCARKTGIVRENVDLKFIGFGTMNGKDGKPFKTRDGGVLRLEYLLSQISNQMYEKIMEKNELSEEEARKTADQIALAAVKYGDLSNQASKDYIFDTERFTSFEGDTGPYILYTMVRIKSILKKYAQQGGTLETSVRDQIRNVPEGKVQKDLFCDLAGFSAMIGEACQENAPHKVCAYIYDLSNDFNSFYHATPILSEEDENKKAGYITILQDTLAILSTCIELLGFTAPERL